MKQYDNVYIIKGSYRGLYGEIISINYTDNIVMVQIDDKDFIMLSTEELEVIY